MAPRPPAPPAPPAGVDPLPALPSPPFPPAPPTPLMESGDCKLISLVAVIVTTPPLPPVPPAVPGEPAATGVVPGVPVAPSTFMLPDKLISSVEVNVIVPPALPAAVACRSIELPIAVVIREPALKLTSPLADVTAPLSVMVPLTPNVLLGLRFPVTCPTEFAVIDPVGRAVVTARSGVPLLVTVPFM